MKTRIFTTFISLLLFITFSQAQNNALEYDGSNDYIQCVSSSIPSGGNNFTVECWFYLDEQVVSYQNLLSQWTNANSGNSFFLGFNGLNSIDNLRFSDNWNDIDIGVWNAGEWHHLAAVSTSDNAYIYLDGVLRASRGSALTYSGIGPVVIGRQGEHEGEYFNGKLDEIRIWNDIRTELEIRQNMYRELPNPSGETNLVAYYKLNETSGTSASDTKGSNDGTLTGMSGNEWQTSPAIFGPKNCLDFDGNDDYVSISDNAALNPANITIEAWINTDDISGQVAPPIVKKSLGPNGYAFEMSNADNTIRLWLFINDTWYSSPSYALNLNEWYHVAGTYDGNTINLYINGIKVGDGTSKSGSITSATGATLMLGTDQVNTNRFYDGKIDEVRIWNDVRTEDEIREYMCKSLTGNEANLIAYYNFDNSSGTALQDLSGNGNDGTLYNMENSDWQSSSAFNTWLNTSSNNPATSTNWSRGTTPTSSDNVGIYNFLGSDPVISSSFDCNNFYLESGASFTMNDGASFIADENEFINGTFNINKTISESSNWHLISVPNHNTTTTEFTGYYLQEWDEISSNWYDISEQGIAMPPCKGYGLWDVPAKNTFSFSGTPNTGEQSISIYSNSSVVDTIGMNLVGNPYPSAIDLNVIDPDYGAFYIWDPTENTYSAYNGGVGDIRYLAPIQGFFVYAQSNGTFTIDNDARTHTGANTFYKSSSSKIENGLVLSTNHRDKLYIKLLNDASEDFDFYSDAYKIVSLGEGNSQLYSKYFDTKLAIDCRPETDIIQLGYQNNQNGTYTIELQDSDGITAELEDTKLNYFHNFSKGAYSFDWNTTDSEERFILHLKATGTENEKEQDAQVYAANGQLYIRMNQENQFDQLVIYDLAGRVITEKTIQAQDLQSIDLNHLSGAYLIQLKGSNNSLTKKIIMK